MTLITITLTGEEQRKLLEMHRRFPVTLHSIAEKIRKTRRAEEAFRTAYELPDTTACGLCGAPRNSHDADDHHWQWNLASHPVKEAYVTRTGKLLTDADLIRYADEAEAGYDVSQLKEQETRRLYPDEFPGEPAG